MAGSRIASLSLLFAFIALIWAVELVNIYVDHRLNQYGVVPRTVGGLRGIPLSPFLHAGFGHLAANTVPLLALGGLVAVRGGTNFLGVTAFIIFSGGAGLWAVGRPWPWGDGGSLVHVGASGLVFGLFGYLVARGIYERSILSILVALVVIVVFGWGILFGLLPTADFVSWEGHLCGLVAGVLVARLTRPRRSLTPGPSSQARGV